MLRLAGARLGGAALRAGAPSAIRLGCQGRSTDLRSFSTAIGRSDKYVGVRSFSHAASQEDKQKDDDKEDDQDEKKADKRKKVEESDPTGPMDEDIQKKELIDKVQEKEDKIEELTRQKARLLAEMENTRMIARRDVENARQYGITKFAKSILEVADNLNRALEAVPQDKIDSGDKLLKELYVGVDMTRKELLKAFRQQNIEEFACEGEKFDPNRHQAMFEAVVPGKEGGTIISVTKKGYVLNERLLRAAEVGVAKAES